MGGDWFEKDMELLFRTYHGMYRDMFFYVGANLLCCFCPCVYDGIVAVRYVD